jgi:hypothetical protein
VPGVSRSSHLDVIKGVQSFPRAGTFLQRVHFAGSLDRGLSAFDGWLPINLAGFLYFVCYSIPSIARMLGLLCVCGVE